MRYFKFLMVLCLMTLTLVPINASENHLIDNSDLYDDNLEEQISDALLTASNEIGIDFVVLTSNLNDSADLNAQALDELSQNGFDDGIALFINDYLNELTIISFGEADNYYSELEKEYSMVAVLNIFKAGGDIYEATDSFIKNARHYYSYDENNVERDPLLVDDADLFGLNAEVEINELLEAKSLEYNVDLVVFTTLEYCDYDDVNMHAADFYDYHNYGPDGYMLYINMNENVRTVYVLTTGANVIASITDYDIEHILDLMFDNLSIGAYENAVYEFVDCFERYYDVPGPAFDMSKRDPLFVDKADLFSSTEEIALKTELEHASNQYAFDFIVFVDDFPHGDGVVEADDFYEEGYYRRDALMLYINPILGAVYVVPYGAVENYQYSSDFRGIAYDIEEMLYDGEYYEAIEYFIKKGSIKRDGAGELPPPTFEDTARIYGEQILMTSVITGLIVSIIVSLVLIKQMNTFKKKRNASEYAVNRGSFYSKADIRISRDIFLYRTTSRSYSPRQRSSSGGGSSGGSSGGSRSFSGSSGRSHGGGGRRF